MLFGEDGDDDEGAGLRVNAQFADKYKERKMKEELTQRRRTRAGGAEDAGRRAGN